MTLIFRLLNVAVVAAVGLLVTGTVAAFAQPRAHGPALAAFPGAQLVATRNSIFRYDGLPTTAWTAAEAASSAEADAQARAEFSARLDAAIVELTPPPAPEPAPEPPPAPVAVPRVAYVAPVASAPSAAPTYSGSVPDLIRSVFAAAGQAGVDWALRVAKCESGFNPNAYNASSGASGVFQFLPSTWRGSPYASSSPFDAQANVRAALWLYQRSGPNQWVCG